jgi:hypothetical protein
MERTFWRLFDQQLSILGRSHKHMLVLFSPLKFEPTRVFVHSFASSPDTHQRYVIYQIIRFMESACTHNKVIRRWPSPQKDEWPLQRQRRQDPVPEEGSVGARSLHRGWIRNHRPFSRRVWRSNSQENRILNVTDRSSAPKWNWRGASVGFLNAQMTFSQLFIRPRPIL